jgi:hypothetical protein
LAQQHHAAIAGHAAAVKSPLHYASAQPSKLQHSNINFFGAVWFRHGSLV